LIILTVRPAEFDRHVPAFDKGRLVQAATERSHHMCGIIGRLAVEEANHGHRWLLRVPREWPRDGRAAEKRDEVASFQLTKLHAATPARGA
jgi:hypothetical protein